MNLESSVFVTTDVLQSLQFDPAPRAGEPLVSRRVPDYFLVRPQYLVFAYPSQLRSAVTYTPRDGQLQFFTHALHVTAHPSTPSPVSGIYFFGRFVVPFATHIPYHIATSTRYTYGLMTARKRLCRFPTCSLNDEANFLSREFKS